VSTPNRFFLSHRSALKAVEFDPDELSRTGYPSENYYNHRILSEINRLVPDRGLTFFLTFSLDYFEEHLRDSVVFLMGDEMYQTPVYAPCVRAIFKSGGVRPNPARDLLKLPLSVGSRVAIRDARNRLVAYRRNRRRRKTNAGPPAPTYEVPLGYWRQRDVPWVPFEQRGIDVFFAGSIRAGGKPSARPSVVARRQMTAAIAAATAALPSLRVEYIRPGQPLMDAQEYSTMLMNSRIALCPRGNFDETFRLFESARAGCAIVSEPLPPRWYYREAPITQIARWKDLAQTLRRLIADPASLAAAAAQTRQWWLDTCSEAAIARYVLERLALSA
jgi:hypothetical protein